jgi:hypothetical protein
MKRLPNWMRGTLIATAIYNVFGVLLFIPVLSIGRRLIGIPNAHPFYLWHVTILIGSFAVLYIWVAARKRSETAFLIIAVIGKFGFWSLNLIFWLTGDFRILAPIVASGDLITAILFASWLWKTRDSKDFSSQE